MKLVSHTKASQDNTNGNALPVLVRCWPYCPFNFCLYKMMLVFGNRDIPLNQLKKLLKLD